MRRVLTSMLLLATSTALCSQTYKVLYNFGGKAGDPSGPRYSGVISQSRGGNMFSSAEDQWTNHNGSAFRMTPRGTLTVVHRFGGNSGLGGIRPVGGLTLATDGLYYGTNKYGGLYGFGNVFRMTQGGSVTILHDFDSSDNASGCSHPWAPPIEGDTGDFFGTAVGDGSNDGCLYRISASGQFAVLHTFSKAVDGRRPFGPLVQGSDSLFYGVTRGGTWSGYGGIFRISSTGDFQMLWIFGTGEGGADSYSGLTEGNDGNFYGTSTYAAFKMTPAGVVTILHCFCGGGSGWQAKGGVVQASDGNLYGTTQRDGVFDKGVLYRLSPAGEFTVLHQFQDSPAYDKDGAYPENTLMQHTNGKLYGTTEEGGTAGKGTFFVLDAGLPRFVRYLPVYGQAGAVVEILGQGFTADSQVSFNGVQATEVTVVYATYIRATVPAGATTGPITVTTAKGTLQSDKAFVVH